MPEEVNTGKYQMMAGNRLDSVAFEIRPAVATVLRTRRNAMAKTAGQLISLLTSPTGGSAAADITQIPNNPFGTVGPAWKLKLDGIVQKIIDRSVELQQKALTFIALTLPLPPICSYPQPEKMGPDSCSDDSQSSIVESGKSRDINYRGKQKEVEASNRTLRSH